MPDLLTGEKNFVYEDSGYPSEDKRENAVIMNQSKQKVKYKINMRPSQKGTCQRAGQYRARKLECRKSSVRAWGILNYNKK